MAAVFDRWGPDGEFGFLKNEKSRDLFVHRSELPEEVEIGTWVTYTSGTFRDKRGVVKHTCVDIWVTPEEDEPDAEGEDRIRHGIINGEWWRGTNTTWSDSDQLTADIYQQDCDVTVKAGDLVSFQVWYDKHDACNAYNIKLKKRSGTTRP